VSLPQSTLASGSAKSAVVLQPLADRLATAAERHVLHARNVAQLDPGGANQRAYLWRIAATIWKLVRRAWCLSINPDAMVTCASFLQAWRGHLMVDDYGGYKALFKQGIIELACLAHGGRKFLNCMPPMAAHCGRSAAPYRGALCD